MDIMGSFEKESNYTGLHIMMYTAKGVEKGEIMQAAQPSVQ